MKRFNTVLDGDCSSITADKFVQVGDFVSFYTRDDEGVLEATALLRLGPGDSIVEDCVIQPKACPDCGFLPGERGGPVKEGKAVSA